MLEYLGSMEQIFGKDSYPYAIALNQYAYFLMRMGRYAESRNILNEAQSIMESAGYTEIDIYAEILLTTNEVLANINPELEKPEDYYLSLIHISSLQESRTGGYHMERIRGNRRAV